MITRRKFFEGAAIGTGTLVLAPAAGTLTGCTISSSTLKSYLNTVLKCAEDILALSSSSDSWYADLVAAITALEGTESSWDGSTAVTAIVSALDTLEAVLAVIPVTSTYSVLIDLFVSVVEYILEHYVSSSTTKKVVVKSLASANPHRGRVPLKSPHFLQSQEGAYRGQWNDAVKALGLEDKYKV
jgi:hypothetical protein